MKIGQVAPNYGVGYGGIETYVYYLSLELTKRGHEITIFSIRESVENKECVGDNINLVCSKPLFYVFGYPFAPSLLRDILRAHLDIIHIHINSPITLETVVLSHFLRNTPMIVTYHADPVAEDIFRGIVAKVFGTLYSYLLRFELRFFSRILTTSPNYIECSTILRSFRHKICVAVPGCKRFEHYEDISKEEARVLLGIDRKLFMVLFVGRLVKYKGLDTLLEAVRMLKEDEDNFRLYVAGDGPEGENLLRMVLKLGLKDVVTLTGLVAEEKLPLFFRSADLFVLPSRSRSEGLGLTLMEALSLGLPCVATRVGGIPFLLKDKSYGLLVKSNDPQELYNALKQLINNESRLGLFKTMVTKTKKFSWKNAVDVIERTYGEACERE